MTIDGERQRYHDTYMKNLMNRFTPRQKLFIGIGLLAVAGIWLYFLGAIKPS